MQSRERLKGLPGHRVVGKEKATEMLGRSRKVAAKVGHRVGGAGVNETGSKIDPKGARARAAEAAFEEIEDVLVLDLQPAPKKVEEGGQEGAEGEETAEEGAEGQENAEGTEPVGADALISEAAGDDGYINLGELSKLVDEHPETRDRLLAAELQRADGPRKGALRKFLELEVQREGGPRGPVLARLESLLAG